MTCNDETSDKKVTNCSPFFAALQYINNLAIKRSYKKKFNLKNLNFLKGLSSGLKIIRNFDKEDQNVYKTANKSTSIRTNQTLLSSNRQEIYLHDLSHTTLKRLRLL